MYIFANTGKTLITPALKYTLTDLRRAIELKSSKSAAAILIEMSFSSVTPVVVEAEPLSKSMRFAVGTVLWSREASPSASSLFSCHEKGFEFSRP